MVKALANTRLFKRLHRFSHIAVFAWVGGLSGLILGLGIMAMIAWPAQPYLPLFAILCGGMVYPATIYAAVKTYNAPTSEDIQASPNDA